MKRRKKIPIERGPIGRPKLPSEFKQKYGRLAVYPHTHDRLKEQAKAAGMNMIDYVEKITPKK